MNTRRKLSTNALMMILAATMAAFSPRSVRAHCDTMDGPVVTDAREALETSDVTPVLKWVHRQEEPEIRRAFRKTLTVRKHSNDARELADMYFFETLVRIHRAGEGAPYTGLKPAGTDPGPAVTAGDEALAKDSAEELIERITQAVERGIRKRFARASETRKHAGESIEAGREFVASYVEFVHYVERLHDLAVATHAHGDSHQPAAVEPAHEASNRDGSSVVDHTLRHDNHDDPAH